MSSPLYMEHVQNCFFRETGWDQLRFYDTLLHLPRQLLQFATPHGVSFSLSSQSTKHTASSLHLTSTGNLLGSMGYCHSSVPLLNVLTTQRGIADRFQDYAIPGSASPTAGGSLYYGRMYFPGSTLEAMYIKRFGPAAQLIVKCVSFPSIKQQSKNLGALTFNYQRLTARAAQEFVYSTTGGMLGYRYLYDVPLGGDSQPPEQDMASSRSRLGLTGRQRLGARRRLGTNMAGRKELAKLTLGGEVWYGALSTAPGLSCALRYSSAMALVHGARKALPFSLSVAINPVIGQVSSSYCVSALGPQNHLYLASGYDINVYSYHSNLTVGFEYYTKDTPGRTPTSSSPPPSTVFTTPSVESSTARLDIPPSPHPLATRLNPPDVLYRCSSPESPENFVTTTRAKAAASGSNHQESPAGTFKSVIKSTFCFNSRLFKLLYDFRLGDFIISLGCDWAWGRPRTLGTDEHQGVGYVPFRPQRVGLSFRYSS